MASWARDDVMGGEDKKGHIGHGRGHGCCTGFAFARDACRPCTSPWPICGKKWPTPFLSHIVLVEIEAQRQREKKAPNIKLNASDNISLNLVPYRTCSHPSIPGKSQEESTAGPGSTRHLRGETLTHALPWAVGHSFLAQAGPTNWDQDTGSHVVF
ncbi:hypothetical protein E5288_WYG009003 [Bos mutus]|uniref:Uncharacterized protein n=1 Tax=Bos mutus TaxID=72004 RepID=A0A6B0QYB6_9CETA|nr:hypothetical protein [Bos mutus]